LGKIDIIKYIVEHGDIEINFGNLNQFYEWMEAINKSGRKEIFEYLAERHIELFTSIAVNEIISWNRLDLLELLVKHHFDVNLRDAQGNTPLVYAIKFNRRSIVNYLIEQGANIFNVNKDGQTVNELCGECYDHNNNNSISIHTRIKRLIEENLSEQNKF